MPKVAKSTVKIYQLQNTLLLGQKNLTHALLVYKCIILGNRGKTTDILVVLSTA